MKQLTKAEEEIMQILWKLKKAKVAEIIEEMFEPKAYTTVSTIIRILETKEFVDHEKRGKGYNYFPVVERETYRIQSMNLLMDNYFNGSCESMLSFFMNKNDLK